MAATISAASAAAASASLSLPLSSKPASRVTAASAQLTPARLSQSASLSLTADAGAARLPRRSTVVRAAETAEVSETVAETLADDGSGLGDSVEGKHRLVLKFVWLGPFATVSRHRRMCHCNAA